MMLSIARRALLVRNLIFVAFSSLVISVAFAAAPKLWGVPITTATVGTAWAFHPSGSDADGNTLTYSIANRPGFAGFSTTSGRLAGTPKSTDVRTYSGIVISVSDGKTKVSLPAFTLTVKAASTTTNKPPTISGTPSTRATVGTAYSFTPTASDPEGKALTFAVSGKPSWLTFSTSTGRLSGTPTSSNVATFSNIKLSASDGTSSVSLPLFSITVATSGGSTPTTGAATLNWTPPTRNTDGSSLTNLAGYRIAYGKSAGSLTQTVQISNPGISSYVIDGLSSGTWYFALKSYTSGGSESSLSNVASRTIP